MNRLAHVENGFVIRIVRIFDHYGFIIRKVSNGVVYVSENTYPDKMTAHREAIDQTYFL